MVNVYALPKICSRISNKNKVGRELKDTTIGHNIDSLFTVNIIRALGK